MTQVIGRRTGFNMQDIIGASTEVKPPNVYAGSTYYETDTKSRFLFNGAGWIDITDEKEFEVSVELTRPADTTQYTINDIINGNGASVLPTLDFGATNAMRRMQINSISILSSNGSASVKLNAIAHLFNSDTITGQSLADNTAFNPTYNELRDKGAAVLDGVYNSIAYGSNAYMVYQADTLRNARLDATGKLYIALIAANAYVPTSGEKLTITLKGYLL